MAIGNDASGNAYGFYLESDTIYTRNAITGTPTVLSGKPFGANACNGGACP